MSTIFSTKNCASEFANVRVIGDAVSRQGRIHQSGSGGLSVLRALRIELAKERLIYIADSGHAPYGERDVAQVFLRKRTITHYGFSENVSTASRTTRASHSVFYRQQTDAARGSQALAGSVGTRQLAPDLRAAYAHSACG